MEFKHKVQHVASAFVHGFNKFDVYISVFDVFNLYFDWLRLVGYMTCFFYAILNQHNT